MQKQFLIILLFIFFSCTSKKESTEEQPTTAGQTKAAQNNTNIVTLTAEQEKNAGIAVGKAQVRNISSPLKVSGQIDVPPENMVTISAPMGGYLASTRLIPGTQVKKGQSIAIIQDQQYIVMQQDYLTAKARVAYLEKEYERQRSLNESKATSDKQYQQTEADYKTQQAMVNGLSERLRLININPEKLTANTITRSVNVYSPINGFVSKVNVSVGKYVTPTDVLFEIIDPRNIHLTLNVFEKDINKLKPGLRVLAYTNSNPDKKYTGIIRLINRDMSADRSAEVHCHIEDWDNNLVPGMFMNAEIQQTNHQAYVLPEDAVVNYENKKYVFVVHSRNEFEMIHVETGTTENGQVEIKSSDKDFFQNSFVTRDAYALLMKLKNTKDE